MLPRFPNELGCLLPVLSPIKQWFYHSTFCNVYC